MTISDTLAALIARYEQLVGKAYRGTLELRGQAEKYEADLRLAVDAREALRTGQLVPVPSVERVAQIARDSILDDRLHKEARRRMLADMTGQSYDFHLARVAAEHGATAVIAAMKEGQNT